MNKKQGFTLIELLAVIVVLAIIALIATPIVMNTIKRSKKGTAERSADSYVKQVEVAIMEAKLENNSTYDGEYSINENGNLTGRLVKDSYKCNLAANAETYEEYLKYRDYCDLEERTLVINMNGTKPTSGKIKISNGVVDSKSSNMTIGDYEVTYNSTKKTYEAKELYKGILCTANTTKPSALVWDGNNDPGEESSYTRQEVGLLASESGVYTPGVTYTCELGNNESNTFYVLEENGANVSLIAGFNLGDKVAWSNDGSNHKNEDASAQAVTAKAALKERTSGWTKLTELQISLPSASQIATAAGKTFDGTIAVSGLPTWLSSYTKTPVAYGYWTSTPDAYNSDIAWDLYYGGSLGKYLVSYAYRDGVRPVITVSKSKLS